MAPQFPQLLSFKAQEFVLGYLFSSLLTSNPFARPSGSPSTSVPFSPSPNPLSCQAPSPLPTATLVPEIQPDSHLPVGLKIPVLITTHKAPQEPCHLAPAPSLAFVPHSPFDSRSFIGGWRMLCVLPQALPSSWLIWTLTWMTPRWPFTQSPDLLI